jgi:hypothetical protein
MDGQHGKDEKATDSEHRWKHVVGGKMGRNSRTMRSIIVFCSVYITGDYNIHIFNHVFSSHIIVNSSNV